MSEPEWQDLHRSGIFEYVSPTCSTKIISPVHHNGAASACLSSRRIISRCWRQPQLGRAFNPEDHSPALCWKCSLATVFGSAFGGDAHILDRSIRLDTDLLTHRGVMPKGFDAPGRTGRKGT